MPDFPSIEDKFLQKLGTVIEAHFGEEGFGITELSRAMAMSRTTLHRKLKKSQQKPAHQFLQEYRLERARELLKHSTGTVSETAYQVGFGNVSYFITCFRNFFGYPPGEILRGNAKRSESATDRKEIDRHKTMAFLPLKNDGPDDNYNFLVEGLREEIISRLSMIKDIEVISRTTSDTYRNSNKPLKEIARELNVNYILEGSFQYYQNKTRVRLQLIEAHTDFQHWSQPYECLLGNNNLFEIQQDLAFKIAKDLHAHLTPEETKSLKRLGTENAAAYLHYRNGIGFNLLAKNETKFSTYWERSLDEFEKAVELDPKFADAWLKLAETTVYFHIWPQRYLSGFLDLHFYQHHLERSRKATQLAHSMGVENRYLTFFIDALSTRALEEMEKKIDSFLDAYNNSKEAFIYRLAGNLFFYRCDYYHTIKYWLKYLELIDRLDIPAVFDMHHLVTTLGMAGCTEHAMRLAEKTFQQTQDELGYKYMMISIMTGKGIEAFVSTINKLHEEFPEKLVFTNMMMLVHIFDRNYPAALQVLNKLMDLLYTKNIEMYPSMFIAYLYHVFGMKDEMEWHCKKILENSIALSDKLVVPLATYQFTELAGIYALLGNRENMYACLNQIVQQKSVLMDIIIHLKFAPNFDPFHQEPEFQTILGTLESMFQSEHDRLEELLHKTDTL